MQDILRIIIFCITLHPQSVRNKQENKRYEQHSIQRTLPCRHRGQFPPPGRTEGGKKTVYRRKDRPPAAESRGRPPDYRPDCQTEGARPEGHHRRRVPEKLLAPGLHVGIQRHRGDRTRTRLSVPRRGDDTGLYSPDRTHQRREPPLRRALQVRQAV